MCNTVYLFFDSMLFIAMSLLWDVKKGCVCAFDGQRYLHLWLSNEFLLGERSVFSALSLFVVYLYCKLITELARRHSG